MRRGRYVKGKKVGKGNVVNVVRAQTLLAKTILCICQTVS